MATVSSSMLLGTHVVSLVRIATKLPSCSSIYADIQNAFVSRIFF